MYKIYAGKNNLMLKYLFLNNLLSLNNLDK